VLGGGVAQDKAPGGGGGQTTNSVVSRGLVRSKTDKLMLVRGVGGGGEARVVQSIGGSGAQGYASAGATALKGDPASSPALVAGLAASPAADRRVEARIKGYVGEACPECGNFTMVRNGTCLKCETCGGTTGCS
jgi:ribonucleoside-diphosphate reductase alpha chain